jgi:cyclophilin family peptidyl-prolyl cis-trans isomerase
MANPVVKLTTTRGGITIELDPAKAPISTENFLSYVKAGTYDGTIFHRVIANFMIQGGGFTPDMQKKPTNKPIKNEWQNGLKNVRGAIAMARLGGDANSATNQFFINTVDNAFLDRPQPDGAAYAVFGKVTEGLEVVDAIRAVKTGNKAGHSDVPIEAVIITKAEVIG